MWRVDAAVALAMPAAAAVVCVSAVGTSKALARRTRSGVQNAWTAAKSWLATRSRATERLAVASCAGAAEPGAAVAEAGAALADGGAANRPATATAKEMGANNRRVRVVV
jgi:hypothetical protein